MSELQVTVRLTIHDGKLSEFKEVAAQLMQSVRENDRARFNTIGSSTLTKPSA